MRRRDWAISDIERAALRAGLRQWHIRCLTRDLLMMKTCFFSCSQRNVIRYAGSESDGENVSCADSRLPDPARDVDGDGEAAGERWRGRDVQAAVSGSVRADASPDPDAVVRSARCAAVHADPWGSVHDAVSRSDAGPGGEPLDVRAPTDGPAGA